MKLIIIVFVLWTVEKSRATSLWTEGIDYTPALGDVLQGCASDPNKWAVIGVKTNEMMWNIGNIHLNDILNDKDCSSTDKVTTNIAEWLNLVLSCPQPAKIMESAKVMQRLMSYTLLDIKICEDDAHFMDFISEGGRLCFDKKQAGIKKCPAINRISEVDKIDKRNSCIEEATKECLSPTAAKILHAWHEGMHAAVSAAPGSITMSTSLLAGLFLIQYLTTYYY